MIRKNRPPRPARSLRSKARIWLCGIRSCQPPPSRLAKSLASLAGGLGVTRNVGVKLESFKDGAIRNLWQQGGSCEDESRE